MFQAPGGLIMVVAATRMHRSLVDFANRSSDACVIRYLISSPAHDCRCRFSMGEDIQTIGLKFAKPKQRPTTMSHNLTEISVHTILEPRLTQQINDSSSSTDENVHEKPSVSTLDRDLERGE